MAVSLGHLIAAVDGRMIGGDPGRMVESVTHDSRQAGPGSVFVAIGGMKHDGTRFASDALASGAVAVASSSPPPDDVGVEAGWVLVRDAREALSAFSDSVHGHPSRSLQVVGITGTNGKTTTAHLLAEGLEAAGVPSAMLGTVETRACGRSRRSRLTTPEAPLIHAVAAEQVGCGGGALVLEVSSHALKLKRADHLDIDAAVFTNLSQDHLDFHEDWDDYVACKRRLFTDLLAEDRTAVVNISDPRAPEITRGCRARIVTYSLDPESGADVAPLSCSTRLDGFEATLRSPWGEHRARCRLAGEVNLLNLMAAFAAGACLGCSPAALLEGMAGLEAVPGRLEAIQAAGGRRIFVDYSHTPDAVRAACATLRPLTKGRLFVIVGCGGDRDRDKRPMMGRAAAEGGDVVIITSDNPRSEEPRAIIDMIVPGVEEAGMTGCGSDRTIGGVGCYAVEEDRARAIRLALASSDENDSILVAGKGHEDYQIFSDRTIHFSDQEAVREALGELGLEGGS
jgi:UDP-N-acetylmuramoyl-L-alanyl-D-glutamate--2,6-diaminopimelate ligase